MILKTPRLLMRELISEDAERFYQLNADPEVSRYTGDAAFADVEAARDFLRGYDHYEKYGFGRWAVIRREDGEFLGWCGIKYTSEIDEYDIGFRFFRACWGRGYATEAAKVSLDYGLSHLRIKTMVGRAMKANTASVKVLEKIGMVYWKSMDFHGSEGVVYKTP